MTIKLATAIKNARLTQIKNAIDNDTNAGEVRFYTGTMPETTGGAITTQTLVATCTLSKPSGTISNGVYSFDVINDDLAADADGTISFGRVVDGAGNFVFDGDAGLSNSAAYFKFASLVAVAGGTVKISAMSLSEASA